MVTKFNCSCGNTATNRVVEYEGALGYEALICKVCGRYFDNEGEHEPDEFSSREITNHDAQMCSDIDTTILIDELERRGFVRQLWQLDDVCYMMATEGYDKHDQLMHGKQIVKYIGRKCDAEIGLNWEIIREYIAMYFDDIRVKNIV